MEWSDAGVWMFLRIPYGWVAFPNMDGECEENTVGLSCLSLCGLNAVLRWWLECAKIPQSSASFPRDNDSPHCSTELQIVVMIWGTFSKTPPVCNGHFFLHRGVVPFGRFCCIAQLLL